MHNFNEALECFRAEMEARFRAKASKHDNSDIVIMTNAQVKTIQGLWIHFESEVKELLASPHDCSEMIDVANMCFALWWSERSKNA